MRTCVYVFVYVYVYVHVYAQSRSCICVLRIAYRGCATATATACARNCAVWGGRLLQAAWPARASPSRSGSAWARRFPSRSANANAHAGSYQSPIASASATANADNDADATTSTNRVMSMKAMRTPTLPVALAPRLSFGCACNYKSLALVEHAR